jgi:phosphate transport system substrate-binding protein
MHPSSSLKSTSHRRFRLLFLLVLCPFFVACGSDATQPTATVHGTSCSSTSQLQGAGSTFDAPLFAQMFSAYARTLCGIPVTYLGGGSGAGVNGLLLQEVDFAATDAPLNDAQLARSLRGPILHIPVTLGTEAIVYHVPGVASGLKLTGPVLASIFLGRIPFWDDPALTQLNPGVSLPHLGITVIHRSDGSGTTAILTHYLSQISPTWNATVGSGFGVNWPTGVGEQGNGGVSIGVGNYQGSIGYVELSYALSRHLPYAQLENAAGTFVAPSIVGAQAAAASVVPIPGDLRFYITDAPGQNAYPIAGYSWVIVYQQQDDVAKGQALADLLWWMIHDGQRYAAPLEYAALPATIVVKSEAQIRLMTCGSAHAPCYQG